MAGRAECEQLLQSARQPSAGDVRLLDASPHADCRDFLDFLEPGLRERLGRLMDNWALALADENRAAAAALVARGLAIDPHFAPLVACQRYLTKP